MEARSLAEALAALAIASLGISARAADINVAAKAIKGLKAATAIPAIWMIVQLLPTPIGAHSVWAYADAALGQHRWGHISLDLGRTVLALAFYTANIALAVAAIFVARDRRRAELILTALTAISALTVAGLLIGKWGLIAGVTNPDEILSGVGGLGILLSLTSVVRALERSESGSAKSATPTENTRKALI